MKIYAALSLISFLLSFELGVYILIRDFRKTENRLFFLFALSASLNALIDFGYGVSETYGDALLWWRFDVFWIFSIVFLVHFILAYTEKKSILKRPVTYVAMYGTALLIFIVELTTDLITGKPVQEFWGWTYSRNHSSRINISLDILVSTVLVLLLALLIDYWEKTSGKDRKNKTACIVFGLSLPIITATIVVFITPIINTRVYDLINIAMIFSVLITGFSIWKYSILSFSPHCVDERVFGTMTESILLVTNNQDVSNINRAAEKLSGYSRKEIIGKNVTLLVEDNGIFKRLFKDKGYENHTDDTLVRDHETVLKTKDGVEIPVTITATLFRDRMGYASGIIISMLDISRHVMYRNQLSEHRNHLEDLVNERTEELSHAIDQYALEIEQHHQTTLALKESEELYRTLVETSPDAIIMIDSDCNLRKVNEKAVSLYGYFDEKDMLANSKTIYGLMDEKEYSKVKRLCCNTHENNYVHDIEINMLQKNGSRFTAEVRTSLVKGPDERKNAVLMVVRDITRKKYMEEKLRLQQRIDSIGHLASGIAHDFNNLLTSIMGNMNLLEMDIEQMNDEQTICLKEALDSTEKAAGLIREFQVLSRECYVERSHYDIHDVINVVLERIGMEYPDSKTPIRVNMEKNRLYAAVDFDQIVQMLRHVVRNSLQAIEEKDSDTIDEIIMQTNSTWIESNHIAGLPEGEYIHISVEDTGVGMSEEIRSKAFDPMFTTRMRTAQKGQGLGLALVYNIVTKNHNGAVEIVSAVGEGTTVHIYLPKSSVSQIEEEY